MRHSIILAFGLAVTLSACGEARTIEYFRAHPDEAKQVRTKCGANAQVGEECGNAVAALNAIQKEAFDKERAADIENTRNNARPVLK